MSVVLIIVPAILQIRYQRNDAVAIARRYAERSVEVVAIEKPKEQLNDI